VFSDVAKEEQFHAAFARVFVDQATTTLCKYESTSFQEDLLYCLDATVLSTANREAVRSFVVKNNYPVVSQFENHNFKVFSHLNKTMVIAILDYSKSYSTEVISALETIARRVPNERKDSYIFGHLDGTRWKTFVRHHEGKTPSLLVVDHDDGRHADFIVPVDSPSVLSASIEEFFELLISDRLQFRDTVPPTLWQKIKHRFETYYPWSIALVVMPLILLGAALFYPYPQPKKVKQQ
jgi:hypothetical protein